MKGLEEAPWGVKSRVLAGIFFFFEARSPHLNPMDSLPAFQLTPSGNERA